MSIASKLQSLRTYRDNIRTALTGKGISAASAHGFSNFASDIEAIPAAVTGELTVSSSTQTLIIPEIAGKENVVLLLVFSSASGANGTLSVFTTDVSPTDAAVVGYTSSSGVRASDHCAYYSTTGAFDGTEDGVRFYSGTYKYVAW